MKNCVNCHLSVVEIKYILMFLHFFFRALIKYEKIISLQAA